MEVGFKRGGLDHATWRRASAACPPQGETQSGAVEWRAAMSAPAEDTSLSAIRSGLIPPSKFELGEVEHGPAAGASQSISAPGGKAA